MELPFQLVSQLDFILSPRCKSDVTNRRLIVSYRRYVPDITGVNQKRYSHKKIVEHVGSQPKRVTTKMRKRKLRSGVN